MYNQTFLFYQPLIAIDMHSVFISELLGGEISPPKFSDSPPKMLRHVVNYTLNTNISPSKFACSLPILVA